MDLAHKVHSAVVLDDRPGHMAAGGGGQIDAHRADLQRHSEAVHGHLLLNGSQRTGRQVLVQIAVGGAGGDGVHADAIVPKVDSKESCELVQRSLTGIVGRHGLVLRIPEAGAADGGNVDDAAALLRHHGGEAVDAVGGAMQVRIQNAVPFLQIGIVQKMHHGGNARVIHEHIQRLELLEDLRCGGFHGAQRGCVALHGENLRPVGFQRFRSLLPGGEVAAENGYVAARLGKGGADTEADAPVPAGDDHILPAHVKYGAHILNGRQTHSYIFLSVVFLSAV